VLAAVSDGDYSVKIEVTDEKDYLDSLAVGINMMIDDLRTHTVHLTYAEKRGNAILGVIEQVARGVFDALGVSINMMIGDIKNYIEEIKKIS